VAHVSESGTFPAGGVSFNSKSLLIFSLLYFTGSLALPFVFPADFAASDYPRGRNEKRNRKPAQGQIKPRARKARRRLGRR
jgi:hypothetical protein